MLTIETISPALKFQELNKTDGHPRTAAIGTPNEQVQLSTNE